MIQDPVVFSVSDQDLEEIASAIDVIRSKLTPHLKTLSADKRLQIPKMGENTVAFVRKACEQCIRNPELAPAFLDIAEVKNDIDAFEKVRALHVPLSQVVESLNDMMLLLGSDAYAGALAFYQSVKNAAKNNNPANTIYDDLANRFPERNREEGARMTAGQD